MLDKFIEFIKNVLTKLGINFKKNYKHEIATIKKNTMLNDKIRESLKSGKFDLKVTDFPEYNVDIKKYIKTKMEDIITKYSPINLSFKTLLMYTPPSKIPTLDELRKLYYCDELAEIVSDTIKNHGNDMKNNPSKHSKKNGDEFDQGTICARNS